MSNKTPLITVYITNYNYARFIRNAIDSVLNQTFQDIELLIIDDGSKDDSKDIIETYSKNDIITIIYQQNRGLNITNNVALKVSKGKYIVRLDADDFFKINALEVMKNALEKDEKLGLVFPDYFIVDVNGNVLSEVKRHDFDKEVNILDQPAHGACTMIRTKFLKELGGYDESYSCQDGYELWVKFINKFKVSNISKTLFSYRRHNNNLTNNENKILVTRSKIKDSYVKTNKLKLPRTAAIIPLRPDYDIPFEGFGNTTFIDHKIEELLSAENILKVIVTSSNILVKKHVVNKYEGKVIFVYRPETLERINVSLFETLNFLSEQPKLQDIEAYLFCSVSYPFIDRKSINDSVNTLSIFKADSLISVRPEGNKFYRHTGDGMKAILEQDSFTKFERESIYKYTGGLILSIVNSAKKAKKLIHGNVGHIVVSEMASLNVESLFEKEICKYLNGEQVQFIHQTTGYLPEAK